jgi:hypothetical protein
MPINSLKINDFIWVYLSIKDKRRKWEALSYSIGTKAVSVCNWNRFSAQENSGTSTAVATRLGGCAIRMKFILQLNFWRYGHFWADIHLMYFYVEEHESKQNIKLFKNPSKNTAYLTSQLQNTHYWFYIIAAGYAYITYMSFYL